MGRNDEVQYKFSSSKTFVNPYNFVHINPQSKDTVNAENAGKHTGYLDCRLTVKTPLIIPDNEKADQVYDKDGNLIDGHFKYPFMQIDGNAVIPGSSIRGPIRNVYETLTNSCFTTLSENQNFTARTDQYNAFKPGVLLWENGQLVLKKAIRYVFDAKLVDKNKNVSDGLKYGDLVTFDHHKRTSGKGSDIASNIKKAEKLSGTNTGYLFIGESFGKGIRKGKIYESIFRTTSYESVEQDELKGAIDRLWITKQEYKEQSEKPGAAKSGGYKHVPFHDFMKSKCGAFPIWFKRNGGKLYLSFASIGRYGFVNGEASLLDQLTPCTTRTVCCKACAMFGLVGDKSGQGSGSHVRISDAVLENDARFEEHLLYALGTPKPSYTMFYLNKNEQLGYDTEGISLRGRKYYWHHEPVKDDQERTKLNATMTAISKGVVFSFRVYYEGLSDEQLQELKWVLTLGENKENSVYCHKIGHAKPLGYGSVKITILSETERIYGIQGYALKTVSKEGINCSILHDNKYTSIDELLRISNMKATEGKDVSYPYVICSDPSKESEIRNADPNGLASHQWFLKNKDPKSANATMLPQILDENITHPVLILSTNLDSGNSGHSVNHGSRDK